MTAKEDSQVILEDSEKEKVLSLFKQQCIVKKLTYNTQSFFDFQKDFVIFASAILSTIGGQLPQEWLMKAMMSVALIESYSLSPNPQQPKDEATKETESSISI